MGATSPSALGLKGDDMTWSSGIFLGCLTVGALGAGCGSLRNTPEQDLVWSANSACEMEGRVSNNVVISRVEPNGRYWVETRNGNAGLPAFFECMNEKMRAAR
jgi:hypothetical protein